MVARGSQLRDQPGPPRGTSVGGTSDTVRAPPEGTNQDRWVQKTMEADHFRHVDAGDSHRERTSGDQAVHPLGRWEDQAVAEDPPLRT